MLCLPGGTFLLDHFSWLVPVSRFASVFSLRGLSISSGFTGSQVLSGSSSVFSSSSVRCLARDFRSLGILLNHRRRPYLSHSLTRCVRRITRDLTLLIME
jgi:hypothetical protein